MQTLTTPGMERLFARLSIEENNARIKENEERDKLEDKPVTTQDLMDAPVSTNITKRHRRYCQKLKVIN